MKWFKRVSAYFGSIALVYGVFVLFVYSIQDKMIYPNLYGIEEADSGWVVKTEKGVKAYWHQGQLDKEPILFFHGNGYGYKSSQKALQAFVDAGYSILIPEYPGYGGTSGKPGKQSILETGAKARSMMPKGPVIVIGNSLGSAPATSSALPGDTLVIVSGFAKMTNVVRSQMPLVPSYLLRDKYDNVGILEKRKFHRSLVMHTKDDQVIPYSEFEILSKHFECSISRENGNHFIAFNKNIQSDIIDYLENNRCHGNYQKIQL